MSLQPNLTVSITCCTGRLIKTLLGFNEQDFSVTVFVFCFKAANIYYSYLIHIYRGEVLGDCGWYLSRVTRAAVIRARLVSREHCFPHHTLKLATSRMSREREVTLWVSHLSCRCGVCPPRSESLSLFQQKEPLERRGDCKMCELRKERWIVLFCVRGAQ